MTDRLGRVWVGTSGGVSRLDLQEPPTPSAPPEIFVGQLLADGERLNLPSSGSRVVRGLELPPGRNNLAIDAIGVSISGAPLTYQWKLDGSGVAWSEPVPRRSVEFASLAPGRYRFLVRAVDRFGTPSATPASVSFRVDAPLWQRPWFAILTLGVVSLVAFGVHRERLRRVRALERIRTQIATDLHDDIGSGLSQIAILSEVGKRAAGEAQRSVMDETASLARTMRESMADIVWSVDPRRDSLVDLVARMRQVTANLFDSANTVVAFDAPPTSLLSGVGLAPSQRRHLLLLVKEAMTNVARHARATHVHVVVSLASRRLRIVVEDDGVGFDDASSAEGTGLRSLRRRARELGAMLDLRSSPGAGTRIELDVPIRRRFAVSPRRT
jgi:two-component sensor histidine kinase